MNSDKEIGVLELSKFTSDALVSQISSIVDNLKKHSSPILSGDRDCQSFLKLWESAKFRLQMSRSITYLDFFELQGLLHRLQQKSGDLDAYMMSGIATIISDMGKIENSIDIEDLFEIDELTPRMLKSITKILTFKFNSIKKYNIDDIENASSSAIQKVNSINNNFISELSSKINDLEQSSIERMLENSNKRIDDLKKTQDGALQRFNDAVQRDIDNISHRIESEINQFENRRETMDALLEKVGLAKDAEVTIEQANKELEAANMLRLLGLGFMCGSIALLIYFFRYYIGFTEVPSGVVLPELKDLGIEFFALRFMTVILVSSPAMYLLKESAAHRAKENLYRQRGTQLLTIRGYLSDLSDEQRSEVKHKLAENFFSFHNGKADTSNVPDFIKNMNEAIKLAHAIKTPHASEPPKREQPNTVNS